MTTQPMFEHTDRDGDTLRVQQRYDGDSQTMLTINGTNHAWLPDDRAQEFARAILDAAGARAATGSEPEPKVEKRGGCYYVDGVHTACSELADTVEEAESGLAEAERRLAVVKFLQAGREQAQADLAAHRDRVAGDIYGIPYERLLSNPARAVRRIVELESAK